MESRRVRRLPTPLGERFRVPHSSHSLNSLRVDRANTDPKPQHGNQGEIAPSQGYIFDVSTILSRVTFLNGLTGLGRQECQERRWSTRVGHIPVRGVCTQARLGVTGGAK